MSAILYPVPLKRVSMSKQTLIVHLDPALARRVRDFLLTPNGVAYQSLNEFIEVALFNQLNSERVGRLPADQDGDADIPGEPLRGSGVHELLILPTGPQPSDLVPGADVPDEGLFVLTNRLSPLKISARVLASIRTEGGWPKVEQFQKSAAQVARALGLRLRAEDRRANRKGPARRWIAYPVGDREQTSLDRFIFSFTLTNANGRGAGPLVLLGLADAKDGMAVLTEPGWQLACAPSPILAGSAGTTLSEEEAQILRRQVLWAKGEANPVREFLSATVRSGGSQRRIEELLQVRHHEWSAAYSGTYRSAMMGRLVELRVLEMSGRGPEAILSLLPAAEEFTP